MEVIPKIIHYCWFGHNPKPELALKCIESWKKFFPNYEIKEWNEENFNIEACAYVKEAYEAKKWAFVSDYARFWILYNYGGIYFDTDVEIIRSIDNVLSHGPFLGTELIPSKGNADDLVPAVNPGLGMGVSARHPFYRRMLDEYKRKHFIMPDGKYNMSTIVDYTTNILIDDGWKRNLQLQCIDQINIYTPDYFCPMDYSSGLITITDNTCSIHHYSQSWSLSGKRESEIRRKMIQIFGQYIGYRLGWLFSRPIQIDEKIKTLGMKKTLSFYFKKYVLRK